MDGPARFAAAAAALVSIRGAIDVDDRLPPASPRALRRTSLMASALALIAHPSPPPPSPRGASYAAPRASDGRGGRSVSDRSEGGAVVSLGPVRRGRTRRPIDPAVEGLEGGCPPPLEAAATPPPVPSATSPSATAASPAPQYEGRIAATNAAPGDPATIVRGRDATPYARDGTAREIIEGEAGATDDGVAVVVSPEVLHEDDDDDRTDDPSVTPAVRAAARRSAEAVGPLIV